MNANGYINASFVTSLFGNTKYIAAQGPLGHTIGDFWSMIWSENTKVIVMLTTEYENGRLKCNKYWPDENSILQLDNQSSVICTNSSEVGKNLTLRVLKYSNAQENQKRLVYMLHFEGW